MVLAQVVWWPGEFPREDHNSESGDVASGKCVHDGRPLGVHGGPGGEVVVAQRAKVLGGVALGLVLGASAVAGYILAVPGAGKHAAVAPRATRSIAASPAPASRATFAGPDGIEARWVLEENGRPGTTAWKIHDSRGSIQGFASQVYARSGQAVTLYVSTAAATFRAEAFRMGYYQGKGARLVWQSAEVAGAAQPSCPVTATINMVACDNWSPSVTFTVTSAFVQGDYLIKLVGSGNQQSYVPLTVWDPASTATYVIKNDVLTWQAWNPYGGYDFYAGLGPCPAMVYPLCSRARVVSFDRPYGAEEGSGNFLSLEYPLVFYAEEHGLDVTYATDLTIEENPRYLPQHRVLLSLGHDECWSLSERQAAVAARDHGVNIVFFAASPILRHVRTQASPLGPDREEVDYRNAQEDPLYGKATPLEVTANTWGSAPADWPESDFVGETYAGFLEPGLHTGFKVADATAWVFRGTGLRDGSVVPGVIASDVDRFYPAVSYPSDVQILAHSPFPASMGQTDLGASYSDMTYYTDPQSEAGVLDTGTNNWIPALLHDNSGCGTPTGCAFAIVQRITGNILRAFGQGPAGHTHPSAANWRQVTGQ